MIYLTGSVGKAIIPHLDNREVGYMCAPHGGMSLRPGWVWAADNGRFGKGWPGHDKWLKWLSSHTQEEISRCLFATAPDVVGDYKSTLSESKEWLPVIRSLGFKSALVAQDGLTEDETPWDSFDVLFIGGTTKWKLGFEAKKLILAAVKRGVPVHVGRVNSKKRFDMMLSLGVASVDGTFLAFGPDQNVPKLLKWVHSSSHQEMLL